MSDDVNHPKHYTEHPSGIEIINATAPLIGPVSNALKYTLRYKNKGEPIKDLGKLMWYLDYWKDNGHLPIMAFRNDRPEVYADWRGAMERMAQCGTSEFESAMLLAFVALVDARPLPEYDSADSIIELMRLMVNAELNRLDDNRLTFTVKVKDCPQFYACPSCGREQTRQQVDVWPSTAGQHCIACGCWFSFQGHDVLRRADDIYTELELDQERRGGMGSLPQDRR